MEQERADFVEEDLDEVKTSVKPEVNVKKLNISMEELERQRAERERERALFERKQRQEQDAALLEAERAKFFDETEDESEKFVGKQKVQVGKINVNFDEIVAMKTEAEKKALASGMKDKMRNFRELRKQSEKYAEEDLRYREMELREKSLETHNRSTDPKRLDQAKRNLDKAFKEREESQSQKLAAEKMSQLKSEIRIMNEAKARAMKEEMENLVRDSKSAKAMSAQEINRLGGDRLKFDKISDQKVAEAEEKLRTDRMNALQEEMRLFEEQRAEMEDEFEVEEQRCLTTAKQIGKLDRSKTSFDSLEQEKEAQRAHEIKQKRMQELKDEIARFEEERENWSGSDIDEPTQHQSVERTNPNKLNFNFEKAQKQKQLEEEQEMRQEKMKKMENELKELQNVWENEDEEDEEEPVVSSNRIVTDPGRLSKQQLQFDKEHYKEMTKPKTKVKKINSNNFFEQMQREKEAEAERRLEEQRLARAEKEREEMIEAKKREMEKELDDLEEEDSYTDEDDMDGSPTFLEPLQDTLFKEGEKFQLSCSIAGFPQPKVIWYHNKTPLPNGEDFKYKVKGTQYYLCMDEVFREDAGTYAIRAINDKGIDISECKVTIS